MEPVEVTGDGVAAFDADSQSSQTVMAVSEDSTGLTIRNPYEDSANITSKTVSWYVSKRRFKNTHTNLTMGD